MSTQKLLDEAKAKVASVAPHHRHAYSNGIALRHLLEEKRPAFALHFELQGPADPLRTHGNVNHVFSYLLSEHAGQFLRIQQALEICESSPAFKEACKILDPLVAEVRRLEAILQDEQAELGAKMAELHQAEQAALAKAQAAIAKDPAIQKLREQLAPFRGKVDLVGV